MYRSAPIKTYKGKDWNRFTTVELYSKDQYNNHCLYIEDKTPGKEETMEIEFRRVKSESAAVQIQIKKTKNNRRSYFSFGIPEDMADDFINALKKPK